MSDRFDQGDYVYEASQSDGSSSTLTIEMKEPNMEQTNNKANEVEPTSGSSDGHGGRTLSTSSDATYQWRRNPDLSKDLSALYGLFVIVTALCIIPLSEIVSDFDTEILRVSSLTFRLFPKNFQFSIFFYGRLNFLFLFFTVDGDGKFRGGHPVSPLLLRVSLPSGQAENCLRPSRRNLIIPLAELDRDRQTETETTAADSPVGGRSVHPRPGATTRDATDGGQWQCLPQSGLHDLRRGISGLLLFDSRDLYRELLVLLHHHRHGHQSPAANLFHLSATFVHFSQLTGQSTIRFDDGLTVD